MLISNLQILNYKSFRDSKKLTLKSGFNVFVGANNSGKTAILDAFKFKQHYNMPHINYLYQPAYANSNQSEFIFDIEINGKEIQDNLFKYPPIYNVGLCQPIREGYNSFEASETINKLLSNEIIKFSVTSKEGAYVSNQYPSHGIFSSDQFYMSSLYVDPSSKAINIAHEFLTSGQQDSFHQYIMELAQRNSYIFKAQRFNTGKFTASESENLEPDSSNLPAALAYIMKNPKKWDKFNGHIKYIFPNIKHVGIAVRNKEFIIQIWGTDPSTERNDLAFELEHCGTGIGQVLSIIYIAMTKSKSIIVIDEPNSFLHPGASKKLIQVLREYDHQYIISTHSPELITVSEPSTLHMVEWKDGESHVKPISTENLDDLRYMLDDLGVSFSDVFGAEKVIWVEGQTEEKCFPLLLKETKGSMPIGVSILAVHTTGDFSSKKDREGIVFQIYNRLTTGITMLPTALAFSFDSETLNESKKNKIRAQSQDLVHFLPRRMYENYLLEPAALAAILNEELKGNPPSITIEQINDWLSKNAINYCDHNKDFTFENLEWKKICNASKLLNDLFHNFINSEYRKTKHSFELTKWLLNHQPDSLKELTLYVRGLLEDKTQKLGHASQ